MSQLVRFCPGCNEKFSASTDRATCPRCGQTFDADIYAPTVAFAELDARNTYVPQADQAPENDDLLGQRVNIYDVEAFLGKGGMARVYRARHTMLERLCALKILNPQLLQQNQSYLDLFRSEARTAAALVHPHVVTIHTIGETDGLHYLEMEYIVGRSLTEYCDEMGALTIFEATRLLLQISSALAAAHQIKMVHRDIKPANVLITADGVAKLADFGLAKRVVSADPLADRFISGTPYFMAPELFVGQPADPRTDIYAMGVTYFFLLTGRLPFIAPSVSQVAALHRNEAVPDVAQLRPEVPAGACEILDRCLNKDPASRFGDAKELYGEVRSLFGSLRELNQLVHEALDSEPVSIDGTADRLELVVQLPEDRTQRVIVEQSHSDSVASQIIRIYSVCGPASESYFRRALELNATLPHGAIAIEEVDGQTCFVMSNSYPRATCDPEEVRQSVLSIARTADTLERQLTGRDRL